MNKDTTYYLCLRPEERNFIIGALIERKNKLLVSGRYTDAVDDLILKFSHAKRKKFRL